MLKRFLSTVLILSMLLMNLSMVVFAATVPVTKDNLNEAFQKFITSGSNDKHYKITVSGDKISIHSDEGDCTLGYDLSGNPTFTNTVTVKKGMNYNKFNEETGKLSATMLGYLAVANIQGVEYEDSALYFAMHMLQAAFSSLSSMNTENSYVIVSDGVTVDGDNSKVIKESEFGKKVIEYAKSLYSNPQSFSDAEGINSFEWKTELQDATSTSCKIVTTLTVNMNADFSQLKEMAASMTEDFGKSIISTPNLTDIAGTKYETAVTRLVSLGVVNGFEDGTFKPTENVTRAQFAKMLVTAKELKLNNTTTELTFSDLAREHWAYDYIKIAVDNKIINGYPDGTFMPESPVTYAEAMAMILRAMDLESTMADRSWPLGYINEAKQVGLLDSVDYSNPDISANRGETAICLYNMLNIVENDSNESSNFSGTTYKNDQGEVILETLEDGQIDFTFSGMVGDQMWTLGMPLKYSNGVASVKDEEFFDEKINITIVIKDDQVTVESHSTDPNSAYNGINGTYLLEK